MRHWKTTFKQSWNFLETPLKYLDTPFELAWKVLPHILKTPLIQKLERPLKDPWKTLETLIGSHGIPLILFNALWHSKCTTASKDTKRKKRDERTNERTNGRTNWVTPSLLELLIAAKNMEIDYIKSKFLSVQLAKTLALTNLRMYAF